jgi:photosynthetic reaction center cytochrome c subunit
VFQNVKVLGDLSVGEFTRHMVAMTAWVAPVEGCNYCHAGANLADDSKYTKVVARRMIEMTRHINADWSAARRQDRRHLLHLPPRQTGAGAGGFTAAPSEAQPPAACWATTSGRTRVCHPSPGTSMPTTRSPACSTARKPIRVTGPQALPSGYKASLDQSTEKTYSLMNHISLSLGVNCTFCHNTQSFASWEARRSA